MSKAHVDPEELRRFASDLKRFNGDLEALVTGIHSRMRALEQSWRDQEQRRFSEQFNAAAKVFGQFLEASQEHVTTLNRKADLVEQYLRTR